MKNALLLIVIFFVFYEVDAQRTIIKNVNVIDVKRGRSSVQNVIILKDKIEWVGKLVRLKNGAELQIIDGSKKYLIPGLIDAHIHFFQSGSLYTRPDVIDLRNKFPYEKEREKGFKNAEDYLKRYLSLGITTVIDAGGPFTNFKIKDSTAHQFSSPNVLVTGPLFSIVDVPELALSDPPIVKISSNQEVDSLFYRILPYDPDFIKVWYIANAENPAEKSFPLVKYISELASNHNLKLAVHATELNTARLAVEAGADILVHSIDDAVIPDDFVKILKAKNITYIPTLIVGNNYYDVFAGTISHHPQDLKWTNPAAYGTLLDLEAIEEYELPDYIRKIRKNGIPKSVYVKDSIAAINLVKLYKAGVNIATGTDAGNIGTLHASSYIQELEAMKKAGLSNAEILRASTINAAEGFGIASNVGSIERNKYADLILLDKNPLISLDNLNSINLIFKNGKIIKPDTLVKKTPESIVQRQVNAYNARNIDAFLSTYSEDIELFNWNGELILKGIEELRTEYESFFLKTPDLFCDIENRIVINNKVIDKEKVRARKNIIEAVAVYEVEDEKIRKVTFIK